MRIGIIGGGASGIYSALLLKQDHPDYEIHLFEKEKKLGRKLCATGNGRCNLLNADLSPEKYNHPSLMGKVIEAYPFSYLCSVVKSFGVPLYEEDGYCYPLSYSAVSYTDYLVDLLHRFNIKVHLGETISDYGQKSGKLNLLTLSCSDFGLFDKLIFTVGGASTPNLGSDGKTFPTLEKHGYEIVKLRPGLCPIKVAHPEAIKVMAGLRRKAIVTAVLGTREVFREDGEVLFKEDGLSGIVIFNLESALMRLGMLSLAEIHVDLLPGEETDDLLKEMTAFYDLNQKGFLDAYFPKPIVSYIYKINKIDESSIKPCQLPLIAGSIKNLVFKPTGVYPFASSQVTIGGVSLSEVEKGLESKKEKGVYFAGEVLDIDGLCGGYNLTWALQSALIIADSLAK